VYPVISPEQRLPPGSGLFYPFQNIVMEIQTLVDTDLRIVITLACEPGHTTFHQRLTLAAFSRLLTIEPEFAKLRAVDEWF
jgi:hypothetical protein